MRKIGLSATKNSLIMIFMFQLGKDFQYSLRMNWITKFRTIVPILIKNGVTFDPLMRLKITVKQMHLKSRSLWPLRKRQSILTEMCL